MKGLLKVHNISVTLCYRKMWYRARNLEKNKCSGGTDSAILKFLVSTSLVPTCVIHQMKGLFKLSNNGVTLWYWKMWSMGQTLEKKNKCTGDHVLKWPIRPLHVKIKPGKQKIRFQRPKIIKINLFTIFSKKCLRQSHFLTNVLV